MRANRKAGGLGSDGGPAKRRVLVVCTGNSCRSHMAEGFLRQAAHDLFEVHSAGTEPAGYVHPRAIEVMAEVGIAISDHRSKDLAPYLEAGVDTVITVCAEANASCPEFPGPVERYHWQFEDPAKFEGTDSEVLVRFREIRDQIRRTFVAYAEGYRQGVMMEREAHRLSGVAAPAAIR